MDILRCGVAYVCDVDILHREIVSAGFKYRRLVNRVDEALFSGRFSCDVVESESLPIGPQ